VLTVLVFAAAASAAASAAAGYADPTSLELGLLFPCRLGVADLRRPEGEATASFAQLCMQISCACMTASGSSCQRHRCVIGVAKRAAVHADECACMTSDSSCQRQRTTGSSSSSNRRKGSYNRLWVKCRCYVDTLLLPYVASKQSNRDKLDQATYLLSVHNDVVTFADAFVLCLSCNALRHASTIPTCN
jgi:hypothetical protein